MQSTMVSVSRECADAALASPLEMEGEKSLATVHPMDSGMVDAMDTAIESALNAALKKTETSSMLAHMVQDIVFHNEGP